MPKPCRLIFSLLGLIALANASKFMIMGRPRHGFVPTPIFSTEGDTVAAANYQYQFRQILDHFDDMNNQTWLQQYWYNPSYYQPGGPIFLMLGGESPAGLKWVTEESLTFMVLAKKYNAAVFQLEHRFYGKSRPTPDQSIANLKWLSSRQALEDAATFIRAMNDMYSYQWVNSSKWVTFGGSYSGALSAWMRERHPELVAGAIASSGPVFAKMDFSEYLDVVQTSLANNSQDCAINVQIGFQQLLNLTQTPNGLQNLSTIFNTCQPVDTTSNGGNDLINFFENVIGNFMGVVQYSQDNVNEYANRLTIPNVCQLMNNGSRSYLTRLNDVNLLVNGALCMDNSYKEFVALMKDTSFDAQLADSRSWTWQTCTEFGYFQSTDWSNNIFGQIVPLPFYVNMCTDIFGSQYNSTSIASAIDSTNAYYGGRDNFTGANVVLPNGSIDPWHRLGIFETHPNPTAIPVYIHGTAHCADMYPARSSDVPELTAARITIDKTIASWIIPVPSSGNSSSSTLGPQTSSSSNSAQTTTTTTLGSQTSSSSTSAQTMTTTAPGNNGSGGDSIFANAIVVTTLTVIAFLC